MLQFNSSESENRQRVPLLSDLPPLCCTATQRPDVAVYQGENLCVTVEVHSSPFTTTVRKTIVGAIDMIRLYCNADSTFTAFTFPRCHIKKTCGSDCHLRVAKVHILTAIWCNGECEGWNKLCFEYQLCCNAICEVDERYLVKLSPNDLSLFPHGSRQLPSWHALLVECESEKRCYKVCSQSAVEGHLWRFMQLSISLWNIVFSTQVNFEAECR